MLDDIGRRSLARYALPRRLRMARTAKRPSQPVGRRPAVVGFGFVKVVRRVWAVNTGRFLCCFIAAIAVVIMLTRLGDGPLVAADFFAAALLASVGSTLVIGVFVGRRFDRTAEDFFRTDAAYFIGCSALIACALRLVVAMALG